MWKEVTVVVGGVVDSGWLLLGVLGRMVGGGFVGIWHPQMCCRAARFCWMIKVLFACTILLQVSWSGSCSISVPM